MDTQNLSAFIEVADSGSFTQAAELLHLSQPAISKRLKALEDQIGQRLFDRVGRSVLLTDAGAALLPYARRVLQTVEDGRRALSHLSGAVTGRLSIGTSHHIGLHRLPPVLKRFVADYPDVDLDLHFMDSEDACEAVVAGKLELGIVTLPLLAVPQLDSATIWPASRHWRSIRLCCQMRILTRIASSAPNWHVMLQNPACDSPPIIWRR